MRGISSREALLSTWPISSRSAIFRRPRPQTGCWAISKADLSSAQSKNLFRSEASRHEKRYSAPGRYPHAPRSFDDRDPKRDAGQSRRRTYPQPSRRTCSDRRHLVTRSATQHLADILTLRDLSTTATPNGMLGNLEGGLILSPVEELVHPVGRRDLLGGLRSPEYRPSRLLCSSFGYTADSTLGKSLPKGWEWCGNLCSLERSGTLNGLGQTCCSTTDRIGDIRKEVHGAGTNGVLPTVTVTPVVRVVQEALKLLLLLLVQISSVGNSGSVLLVRSHGAHGVVRCLTWRDVLSLVPCITPLVTREERSSTIDVSLTTHEQSSAQRLTHIVAVQPVGSRCKLFQRSNNNGMRDVLGDAPPWNIGQGPINGMPRGTESTHDLFHSASPLLARLLIRDTLSIDGGSILTGK